MISQERTFTIDTEDFLRKLQAEADETVALIQAHCFSMENELRLKK
jgi:hypothetical protein